MDKFFQDKVFGGAWFLLLALPAPFVLAREGFLPNGSMKLTVPKTEEIDLKGNRKKLISTFDPVTRDPIVYMQDGKFLFSGAIDPDRTKPYCKLTLKDSVSGVDFATRVQTTGGRIARYEYGPRCSVAKQDLLVQKSLKGREDVELPRSAALSAIACSGRLEARTVGSLKKNAMAPHRLTGDLFKIPGPGIIQFVTVPNLDDECFLEKDPCVRMLNECSPNLFAKADAKGCVKKQQNVGISDSVPLNSVKLTFEKENPLVFKPGVEVTSITCQPGTVDHTAGLPVTYSDYGMKVIGAWGSPSRSPASSSVLIEANDLEKVMGAKFFEGAPSSGGNRKSRKGPGG